MKSWRRLITVFLAIGSLPFQIIGIHGQDEYMTCSRPIKSSRSSRQHVPPPCETMGHSKDSWCILPGPTYPWHSVRRFVFENQGLMRRMYGEVRQLSVLRMEFSGESNTLDEGRELDEVLKPITTFDHSLTLSSYATTENIPTLVVTSSGEENDILSPTTVKTQSSEENIEHGGRSNGSEEEENMTTISDLMTTTEESGGIGVLEKDFGENTTVEVSGVTEDPPPPLTTLSISEDSPNPEEPQGIMVDLNSVERIQIQGSDSIAQSASSQGTQAPFSTEPNGASRIEDAGFFRDVEKSSTTSTTTEEPRIKTTNRQGVNACPVKEEVVAPYWANNTRGEVLALLNLYPFEQYIHWETCTNEHRQMYCRDGCRCEQQYRLHRLLAFDPQNECRGIFSDWFRFPSCCVCKCYFNEVTPERVSFNRSPRVFPEIHPDSLNSFNLDGPDVNGVDDSHFFYKYSNSFRQPRK